MTDKSNFKPEFEEKETRDGDDGEAGFPESVKKTGNMLLDSGKTWKQMVGKRPC